MGAADEPLLTLADEAALLGVSPQTVRRWRKGTQAPRVCNSTRWHCYRTGGKARLEVCLQVERGIEAAMFFSGPARGVTMGIEGRMVRSQKDQCDDRPD